MRARGVARVALPTHPRCAGLGRRHRQGGLLPWRSAPVDALGASLERMLVVTKCGHLAPELLSLPGVEAHESAHPVPDERSLAAGQRLLEWVG